MPPIPTSSLPEPFATVLSLYDEGMLLAALEAGRAAGPLESWPAIEPQVLGGRLATYLGAPRLAARIHHRAYRAHREHPLTQYYYVFRVGERRGALAGWLERQRLGAPSADAPVALADYHGQCAMLLGVLRDFERAEEHVARAREPGPRPYWYVERSALYHYEDRYAEALRVAEEGLARHPRYPPCILATMTGLIIVGREADALELLRASARASEASSITAHLIQLLIKLHHFDEAEEAIARFDRLTPLKEKHTTEYIANARAEIATRKGDYATAMHLVQQISQGFHGSVAANLREFLVRSDGRPARHAELPVTFVRQHHLTCAPATLTAISHFWDRPAEHLAVAEEICYDGTSQHSERRWAEEHGWATKEFRVDMDSAMALIDRGIPFTLSLGDTVSGHLQAVIGYDEPMGVLYTRDPYQPDTMEINARALFEQQRALGPRGLALVPRERAQLLEGLRLPDAEMYDQYHRLNLALAAHDRELAFRHYGELVAAEPAHRLTLTARSVLAAYDANPHEAMAANDALLALFPDDPRLLYSRLRIMKQVASRADRLAWLEATCARQNTDPIFRIERASELAEDHRRLLEAVDDVRHAMRSRRDFSMAIFYLAALYRQLRRDGESLELSRLAACLDDRNESCANAYFESCRLSRRTDEAIAFLRDRVERLGDRSGAPAMTLFKVLDELDRTEEGFLVLDRAVARRPDDGALRLFAANACARFGRQAEALEHRTAAAGHVQGAAWGAAMARDARARGDREQALALWQDVLRLHPLDLEAHRATAELLSGTVGRAEATARLRAACENFPHHFTLRYFLYEWTDGDPASEREPVIRELLRIDSANGWARRELAINLWQQSRLAEAREAVEAAIAGEPAAPAGHSIKGHLLDATGDREGAAAAYREAIRRASDDADTMRGLLSTAGDSPEHRKGVMDFIESELLRRAVPGDGLLAFRGVARGVLTPEELLAALRRAHEQRPDLWQAWSALGRHLSEMGKSDEALEIARRATEQFGMVPRVWFDLSQVYRDRREREGQVQALERCRELSPEWTAATLELIGAWEERGRSDECVHLLEGAIKRTPMDAILRRRLAALHYDRRERPRALEVVRELLRLSPDDGWGWNAFARWSHEEGDATAAFDLARSAAEARPGESRPWHHLAEMFLSARRPADALEAADRAIAIDPRDADGYDAKARALVELRLFQEAEQACRPAVFGEQIPHTLRGRAAWVDARRGDVEAAIKKMEAVVAVVPDYRWGWGALMEWYDARKDYLPALRAAERLHWLDPTAIVPYGWMGELREHLGHTKSARETYERAMWLQPSYLFAGVRNFQLQLAAGDESGAQRTLEIIRPFASAAQILALQVDLAVRRGDRAAALLLLRALCLDPAHAPSFVRQAADAIGQNGWQPELERELTSVMQEEVHHGATPDLWARSRVARGKFASEGEVRRLAQLGEVGEGAISVLLDGIGGAAGKAQGSARLALLWHLSVIRRQCYARGKTDVRYWGKVGYALVSLAKYAEAIRWLGDWRERAGVESWMLQNLAVSYLQRRKTDEARAVIRHVVHELPAESELNVYLKHLSIMAALLDDELDLAERLLHETPIPSVLQGDRPLRKYLALIAAVLRDPPELGTMTSERWRDMESAREQVNGVAVWQLLRLVEVKVAAHTKTSVPPVVPPARSAPPATRSEGVNWWWIIWLLFALSQI